MHLCSCHSKAVLILPASLHRLGYAEERLRFALQLHQPSSSDSTSASTTGSSRPTAQENITGGLAGAGTSLHGSQAAAVLHMEVQRLVADRAMLLHNLQVRYMCCTALYCTVLYCTVLYCTVLYCTVLYCVMLYCVVMYHIDVGQAYMCVAQMLMRRHILPHVSM